MYLSGSDKVQNQKLKVQEVTVRFADTHLYATSGSHSVVLIGEALSAIVSLELLDDSASAIVLAQASALSIVDSSAYTSGGDESAIKVNNMQMASNDCLRVQYISSN